MGITKKAISVGVSAALLASLVATAFAGSAFAASAFTGTLSASPTSITANGTSTSTITATVPNWNSSVITMAAPTITGGGSLGTWSAFALSGTNGVATATYTSGTTAGPVTIAETGTDAASNTYTFSSTSLTLTAGPATNLAASASPTIVVADGTAASTITATVTDAHGNAVSGATVNFATTLGTLTPASATTSASGVATSLLKSTSAGTATVVVTSGALTASPNPTVFFTVAPAVAPAFTSASSTGFVVGTAGTFTVTASGTPTPTLSESGALPSGVTFTPATGVLAGTPATGTAGTYALTFTATNTAGTVSQSFTLTVTTTPVGPTTVTTQGNLLPWTATATLPVPADGLSSYLVTFNATAIPGTFSVTGVRVAVTGGYFLTGAGAFGTQTFPLASIALTSATGLPTSTLKIVSTTAGSAVFTVYYTGTGTGVSPTAGYDSSYSFTFSAATSTTVSTAYSSNTTQPSSIPASPSGDTGKNIVTTVRDSNNNAITGASVTWTLSPLGYFAGGSNTATVSVNSAGVFTSPDIYSTGAVGATTLTTSISYIGVTYTLPNATITFVGSPAKIVLSNTAYSLTSAGTSDSNALVAVVTDAAGNAIKSGLTFSVGAYTPANIFTVTPGTYSSNDGGWDIAAACSTYGSGTVTVTVPGASSTTITSNAATLVCADPLASTALGSFKVSAASPTVAPNGTDVISVSVLDDNGLAAVDGTSVTAVTNGVGQVVSSGGTLNSATTSNGVAKFTYLAPSNAGSAAVTVFVGNTTTGSAAVTLTIGTPAPAVSYTAASALGVTTSGPFSTATKLPKIGKYVTVKFSFGAANAGKTVIIDVATKTSGVWSAFKGLTTRVANSNGDVFFYWKSSSAAWLSIYGDLGGAHSNSVQARWM